MVPGSEKTLDSRLPNLVIAGVYKAATTSLFMYLSAHEDVRASRIKETRYFLPLRYGRDLKPFAEYRKHFLHCGNQRYVLEATPGYFYGGRDVAEAVRVLFFEHLKQDIPSLLSGVGEWLDLDPSPLLQRLTVSRENRTVGYKSQLLQQLALKLNRRGEAL